MLLTIMLGLPKSGKTTVAKKLMKNLPDCIHINPEDLRIPGYEDLDPEAQKDANVAAWEVANEYLEECIDNKQENIIFDTCGTNTQAIALPIKLAKNLNYSIKVVFVNTPVSVCKSRIGSDRIVNSYVEKLKPAIVWYYKNTDKVIKIDGHRVCKS